MKNTGVTLILLSTDAPTVINYTIVEMNIVDPTRLHMVKRVPSEPLSSPPAAEIAANTSGAPFPNANKVTPANDSES